jgi:hypothetical protein
MCGCWTRPQIKVIEKISYILENEFLVIKLETETSPEKYEQIGSVDISYKNNFGRVLNNGLHIPN